MLSFNFFLKLLNFLSSIWMISLIFLSPRCSEFRNTCISYSSFLFSISISLACFITSFVAFFPVEAIWSYWIICFLFINPWILLLKNLYRISPLLSRTSIPSIYNCISVVSFSINSVLVWCSLRELILLILKFSWMFSISISTARSSYAKPGCAFYKRFCLKHYRDFVQLGDHECDT